MWDMDEDTVIIDGLNIDKAQKVSSNSDDDFFLSSWDDVRKSASLEKNFKRRSDNFVKRQAQGTDAGSKQINPKGDYWTGYGILDLITPPYNLNDLSRYYESHFANHAAVDAKVSNMVSLGYKWEMSETAKVKLANKKTDEQRQAARRKIDRLKITLGVWLDSLNKEDTFTSTMEKVVTDLHALGNGYLEVGRKSNGEIGYLGHIPAVSVRVRRNRDGFVQQVGKDVVFFQNFGEEQSGYNPITTDPNPNQILHFKIYSPQNTFYGVPDIVSSSTSLLGDQFAQAYNIDYFENKAVPRYVVYVKGAKLSSESERRLFEFMQNNLKGNNHRTLLIPLPPDNDQTKVEFKMEAVEAGVQEGSFGKYHTANVEDILSSHQVPLSKIGLGDGSLAGTLAADRTFKEQVARPGQRLIEKRLDLIISEVTDVLVLRFKELTLTDETALAQINEKYLRNQVLTPNEVRESLGYAHIEGGDKVIELNPKQAGDAKNEAEGKDERATDRENNSSDSTDTVSGRNPKGEGNSRES